MRPIPVWGFSKPVPHTDPVTRSHKCHSNPFSSQPTTNVSRTCLGKDVWKVPHFLQVPLCPRSTTLWSPPPFQCHCPNNSLSPACGPRELPTCHPVSRFLRFSSGKVQRAGSAGTTGTERKPIGSVQPSAGEVSGYHVPTQRCLVGTWLSLGEESRRGSGTELEADTRRTPGQDAPRGAGVLSAPRAPSPGLLPPCRLLAGASCPEGISSQDPWERIEL